MTVKPYLLTFIVGLAVVPCALADDCRSHVSLAEAAHAVPTGLLSAIGYVESGMDSLAVNADGAGYHPSSMSEAVSLVRGLQRAGARFIDVGCMQVDLAYHPRAFSSLEDAFEPAINAAVGASLLVDNRTTYGDWTSAVAYYHSSDPSKQLTYLRRVSQQMNGGPSAAPAPNWRAAAAPLPRLLVIRLRGLTIVRPAEPPHPYEAQ